MSIFEGHSEHFFAILRIFNGDSSVKSVISHSKVANGLFAVSKIFLEIAGQPTFGLALLCVACVTTDFYKVTVMPKVAQSHFAYREDRNLLLVD
jgi:hypothetical protein